MASEPRRSSISSIYSTISKASNSSMSSISKHAQHSQARPTSHGSIGRPATPPQHSAQAPLSHPSPLAASPSLTALPTLAPSPVNTSNTTAPPTLSLTSLPAPTPPKERLAQPMTPQRKPVSRQKSPLSHEAWSTPASSAMPGAFPADAPPSTPPAQFQTIAYSDSQRSPDTTPNSKSQKRPKSRLSSLLGIKALRKSYDNTSPDAQARPQTPSASSMASSTGPSLKKKVSGMFGKRSSSLGMSFTAGGEVANGGGVGHTNGGGMEEDAPNRPSHDRAQSGTKTLKKKMSGMFGGRRSSSLGMSFMTEGDTANLNDGGSNRPSTTMDDAPSRSDTPMPGEQFPTRSKRKSGTFWQRKSSLNLMNAMDVDGGDASMQKENVNGRGRGNDGGNGLNNGHRDGGNENALVTLADRQKSLPDTPPMSPVEPRSVSPPPQLPEFVGAGMGLGGEDLFKDIF